MSKYGFSALNQNLNPTINNGFAVNQLSQQTNLITPVRVLSIVLDESADALVTVAAFAPFLITMISRNSPATNGKFAVTVEVEVR